MRTFARGRRIRFAILALAAVLIAASPVRRHHGGCTPFPRDVHVIASSWDLRTDLPDGPVSWDLDFTRNQGPAKTERSFVDPASGNIRPPAIEWAGDLTSSLVMLSDSTERARRLIGLQVRGVVPHSVPGSDFGAEFLYSEVDWPGITGRLGIPVESIAARFETGRMSLPAPGTTPRWPSTQNTADSWVTPHFRSYDHGVCSVNVPWVVDANDPMQANAPFPSLQQLLGAVAALPRVGDVYIDEIVPLGFFLRFETETHVRQLDMGMYPRLEAGGPILRKAGISFPLVGPTDDSIVLAGNTAFRTEIHEGPLEASFCDGRLDFAASYAFDVIPGNPFPTRVSVFEKDYQLNTWIDECRLSGWLASPVVREVAKDKLHDGLENGRRRLALVLNSIVTPPLPSISELSHWLGDTCAPIPGVSCTLPTNPPPGVMPTEVGSALCNRRMISPPGAIPVVVQNGQADMQQYVGALLAGQTVPPYTLTTNESTAPFERTCQAQGQLPVVVVPDRRYQGCLTQDLRVDPHRCPLLLDEYRTRLGEMAPRLPNDEASDRFRDRILAVANSLVPDDLECRPVNPQARNYAEGGPTLFCPNDDPRAPLCRIKGFTWTSGDRQEFGFPPDGYECEFVDDRPLPRRTPEQCAALANVCGNGGGSAQCIDYWYFCGTKDQYCGNSGPVEEYCRRQPHASRCTERALFCDLPRLCDSNSPVFRFCESNPQRLDCPPSSREDPSGANFRSECQIRDRICDDFQRVCSPNTCHGKYPIQVDDHVCAVRLPVKRFNITPASFEVVLADQEDARWHSILSNVDHLVRRQLNQDLHMCFDPTEQQGTTRNFNRAGIVPRITLSGNPP